MDKRNLMATGIIGAAVAAVCCFTPALVILLGVVGLSGLVGYLDYVLLPALVVQVAAFVLIVKFAPVFVMV